MTHHLLSFLGTNNYATCVYTHGVEFSQTTAFSSHAIAALIKSQTDEIPQTTVFLTKTAEAKNKSEFVGQWPNSTDTLDFMQIPEDASETHYWQIFQTINQAVPDGATVWLDITHSFRYLPMLGYAVLQYLQTVRKSNIGGIYYGAAEVLGPFPSWPQAVDERRVPLHDLTAFLKVNQWTAALRDFNESGSAQAIRELTDAKSLPLVKASKGKDEQAQAVRKLGIALDTWTQQVMTCRGRALQQSPIGQRIPEYVDTIHTDMLPPLSAEFDKLRNYFGQYTEGASHNVFLAAEWCNEKGLTQQAWTLLQEGIITYFSERWCSEFEHDYPLPSKADKEARIKCAQNRRKFTTQVFQVTGKRIPVSDWKDPVGAHSDLGKHLQSKIPDGLAEAFTNLSQSRNDINHAGFLKNAIDHKKIIQRSHDALNTIKDLIPEAFCPQT